MMRRRRPNHPHAGLAPVTALCAWIFNSHRRGLPQELGDRFAQKTIAQMMGEPCSAIDGDFVTAISAAVNEELAAINLVIATKIRSAGTTVDPGPPATTPTAVTPPTPSP